MIFILSVVEWKWIFMDLSFSENAFYHICPRVEMNSHESVFAENVFFFICPCEDRGNNQCGNIVCPVCNKFLLWQR